MSDLQALFDTLDQLPPDELEQVQRHIERQRQEREHVRISNEDVEERIAGIRAALAEFREGLTAQELSEIVAELRIGYISPKEIAMYAWLDDLPEDER